MERDTDREGVKKTIIRLRCGKAAGMDGIVLPEKYSTQIQIIVNHQNQNNSPSTAWEPLCLEYKVDTLSLN